MPGLLLHRQPRLFEFMNEQWKTIPGFENYSVSDMGNFRRKTDSGFTELRGRIDRMGYRVIGLVKERRGKQQWFLAHRLVASCFIDPSQLNAGPDEFLTVNHKDRDKSNNALSNLELVSMAHNARHWRKTTLKSMACPA